MNKNKKLIFWGAIAAFVLIIAFWLYGIYNTAIEYEETIDEKWTNLQGSYKTRFDKYTSMLDVVEGAAQQEQEVLIKVTEARALVKQGMNANSIEDKEAANNGLRAITSSLMGYQERYPDLKSMQLFLNYQTEIAETENIIRVARERYSKIIKDYNTHIRKFPNSLVCGSFERKEPLKIEESKTELPDTKMNIRN